MVTEIKFTHVMLDFMCNNELYALESNNELFRYNVFTD